MEGELAEARAAAEDAEAAAAQLEALRRIEAAARAAAAAEHQARPPACAARRAAGRLAWPRARAASAAPVEACVQARRWSWPGCVAVLNAPCWAMSKKSKGIGYRVGICTRQRPAARRTSWRRWRRSARTRRPRWRPRARGPAAACCAGWPARATCRRRARARTTRWCRPRAWLRVGGSGRSSCARTLSMHSAWASELPRKGYDVRPACVRTMRRCHASHALGVITSAAGYGVLQRRRRSEQCAAVVRVVHGRVTASSVCADMFTGAAKALGHSTLACRRMHWWWCIGSPCTLVMGAWTMRHFYAEVERLWHVCSPQACTVKVTRLTVPVCIIFRGEHSGMLGWASCLSAVLQHRHVARGCPACVAPLNGP